MLTIFQFENYVLFNRILLFLVISLSLFLGGWIYLKDKKNRVNQLFFLMSIFFSLWPAFGYLTFFSTNPESSHFWVRLAYASVSCFTVILYFFFTFFFGKEKISKIVGYVVLIGGLFFALLSLFTNQVVSKIEIQEVGVKPIFGYGAYAFYIYVLAVFVHVFYQFYKNYLTAAGEERRKIQYFFIGTSVFLLLNTVFNIIVPIIRGSFELHQFGNYAAIFLLGFTAYAIVKHKLFDIKVITTEALTLFIWIVLFLKLLDFQSGLQLLIDASILIVAIILGLLLIRSVKREVKQRERLQILTKRLQELDQQKDEFISVAAHELRAPMTAIKGYLSFLVEGDAGKLNGKASEFLEDALEGNERLIRLVNNMLNVSRIEEGRLTYKMGYLDLNQVVKTVFNEHKLDAENKKLDYQLAVESLGENRVYVDLDRIHEVVSNLISNAIKYTDEGSIKVRIFNPSPQRVRVEVVDTGEGLSSQEQARLFAKFYRAESNVGKKLGTGLGLYISKLLVKHFNGEIGVVSEKGKGSIFWFELPLPH